MNEEETTTKVFVGTLEYLLERGHMADREVVGGVLLKCILIIQIVTKWFRIDVT
jgi:hypothetical protein